MMSQRSGNRRDSLSMDFAYLLRAPCEACPKLTMALENRAQDALQAVIPLGACNLRVTHSVPMSTVLSVSWCLARRGPHTFQTAKSTYGARPAATTAWSPASCSSVGFSSGPGLPSNTASRRARAAARSVLDSGWACPSSD